MNCNHSLQSQQLQSEQAFQNENDCSATAKDQYPPQLSSSGSMQFNQQVTSSQTPQLLFQGLSHNGLANSLHESWQKSNGNSKQLQPHLPGNQRKKKSSGKQINSIPEISTTGQSNTVNGMQNTSHNSTCSQNNNHQLSHSGLKMNGHLSQKREPYTGITSASVPQMQSQEQHLIRDENNVYIDDPNEAVKEVLRQILDEESKKGNSGLYGLSVGGLSGIPKFTKEIIKQEILHEKQYQHQSSLNSAVSGFTSSTATTSTTASNKRSSHASRRLNNNKIVNSIGQNTTNGLQLLKEVSKSGENTTEKNNQLVNKLLESSSNDTLKLPRVSQQQNKQSVYIGQKIKSAHERGDDQTQFQQFLLQQQHNSTHITFTGANQEQNHSAFQNQALASTKSQNNTLGKESSSQQTQQAQSNFNSKRAQQLGKDSKSQTQAPNQTHQVVEIPPKTGIEQVFMRHNPNFIRGSKEFEPVNEGAFQNKSIIEEYRIKELSRTNQMCRMIYDCNEVTSPYYASPAEYLNPQDQIVIPIEKQEAQMGNFYLKGSQPNANHINKYFEKLQPYYKITDAQDDTLVFESRFESGNLRKVVQIDRFEYELYLKTDHPNTSNYTQWFYFKVANTRRFRQYTFHIINFIKPDSSFNEGMKPVIYSRKESETKQTGWIRAGEDIAYYPTSNRKPNGGTLASMGLNSNQQAYTLSFKLQFKYDLDDVYISYCYPYTYSDCQRFLNRICTFNLKDRVRRAPLCKTIAGNDCDMLIITNFNSSPEDIAERPAIILSGRVHPGESNASYIMEGIIDYLISNDDPNSNILRNRFVFKIVPMLNPDGVIVGNYRCSLSGLDLNRQWIAPNSRLCPEIVAVKQMMRKTLESRDIFLYCDFHGHSRAKNVFMYGCNNNNYKDRKLKERIFPNLFGKVCEHFSFENCSFNIQKAKEATARVVMWKEFSLINSFTLECSFCGPTRGLYKDCHFTISMLLEIGGMFCQTLVDFTEKDQTKVRNAFKEIEASQNKSVVPGLISSNADDGEKQGSTQPTSISTNATSIKIDNLIIKSEGLKGANSVDTRQQQQKTSYIRAKYAGIKKVRGKNTALTDKGQRNEDPGNIVVGGNQIGALPQNTPGGLQSAQGRSRSTTTNHGAPPSHIQME